MALTLDYEKTPQYVFEACMHLADELSDNGSADTSDTAEYKQRTLPILNGISQVCFPYSDTVQDFGFESGRRPVAPFLTSFEDYIQMDDFIVFSVMPLGLGAYLFADENPTLANTFFVRYQELLHQLEKGFAVSSEDTEDVYFGGGSSTDSAGNKHIYSGWPYGEFTRWD
jgi:hypothetical protein